MANPSRKSDEGPDSEVRGKRAAEQEWFVERFACERVKLIRVAERIMGSRADAEDAVQDTFLRAWRQVDRYDAARGTEAAWLHTIVRSVALDLIRRRNAVMRQPVPDLTVAEREVEALRSDAPHQMLRAGIALLPGVERAVIDMAYFEGLSHRQVANAMNLPLGTVKSRLLAGMRHLRMAVPRDALEHLLIDRGQAEQDRISALLDARLLRHASDMYFVDFLEPGRRMRRAHWGHVDPLEHDYIGGIWRFAPDTAAQQHPARQAVDENRPQVVLVTPDSWKEKIAISTPHLSFMRKVKLESLICQPLVLNGRVIGVLTLVRTRSSGRHFTADEGAAARGIAAEVTRSIGSQVAASQVGHPRARSV